MLRLWLLLISVFLLVEVSFSGSHYHRYMLSDYRPQHSHKSQMDYKRVARPNYTESSELEDGKPLPVPTVRVMEKNRALRTAGTERVLAVNKLLVTIRNKTSHLCLGILYNMTSVLTINNCVKTLYRADLRILDNVERVLTVESDPRDWESDSRLSEITVTNPASEKSEEVKLCQQFLQPKMRVQVPDYQRKTRSIQNRVAEIMSHEACHEALNKSTVNDIAASQAAGKEVPFMCIENKQTSMGCQNTRGSPIIYHGELCGFNWSGHNCETHTTDVYVPVQDITSINKKLIGGWHMEDSMFN